MWSKFHVLRNTPAAPRASALKTSVPRQIPPSRKTGILPCAALTTHSTQAIDISIMLNVLKFERWHYSIGPKNLKENENATITSKETVNNLFIYLQWFKYNSFEVLMHNQLKSRKEWAKV